MKILNTRFAMIVLAFCLWLVASTGQAAILSKLNEGKSLTISAIGTSLTAEPWGSWFGQMGTWLNTEYHDKVTLDNQAIGGSNSYSGLSTQLGRALANNPDAIFIEFAYNDASTGSNMSVQTSKENLQTMIDTIALWTKKNKPVDIVIQTMNNDPYTGLRPNLETYYQGYREVAKDNKLLLIDHDLNWVDLYGSNNATWLDYVPDTIHPDPLGTQMTILPEIQKVLTNQVPEPSMLALVGAGITLLAGYWWRKRNDLSMAA